MVAVRSAHLNKAGEFDPKKWIASLGISSQQSCERLAETRDYCREKTQGHPQADLLLWRGVEMVEILSTLSMDIDTLRAALLFPLADGEVVSEEVMQESVGKSVVTLIHGVRDMAAIRQLKATHTDSVSSEQVDNIRRMLLAMVDDFRCVVIKLAERIAHLREVKDAPEDERVLAAKECTNIYAPGEPLRYRPAEVGAGRLLLPLSAPGGIQAHCQTAPRAPYRPRALHRRVCRPPALRDESRRRQGGSLWPAEAYLQYLAQNAEKTPRFRRAV